MQAGVDAGRQPWLLDPAEVALSFAAGELDWAGAEAYPRGDGRTVEVRGPGGAEVVLTVEQPGRTGERGIWVVTAARPA